MKLNNKMESEGIANSVSESDKQRYHSYGIHFATSELFNVIIPWQYDFYDVIV